MNRSSRIRRRGQALSLATVAMLLIVPQAMSATRQPAAFVSVTGTQTETWRTDHVRNDGKAFLGCGEDVRWQTVGSGSLTTKFQTAGKRSLLLQGLLGKRGSSPLLRLSGSLKTTRTANGTLTSQRIDGCEQGTPRIFSEPRTGCGKSVTGYKRYANIMPNYAARARYLYLDAWDLLPSPTLCPLRNRVFGQEALPKCTAAPGLRATGIQVQLFSPITGTLPSKRLRTARKPFTVTVRNTINCNHPLSGFEPGAVLTSRVTSVVNFKFYPGYKCGFDVCLYSPLPKRV